MDSLVIAEAMGKSSLKDKKCNSVDCSIPQKDEGKVNVKKEIENDGEEFSEIAVQDLKEENFSIAIGSSSKEIPLELKEEELEDFEFRSVGPSSSAGVVSFKIEDNDRANSFHEEEMNFPIATDDSASEEDPLELEFSMQKGVKEENILSNLEEHSKEKNKKLINEKPGNHAESLNELKYILSVNHGVCMWNEVEYSMWCVELNLKIKKIIMYTRYLYNYKNILIL